MQSRSMMMRCVCSPEYSPCGTGPKYLPRSILPQSAQPTPHRPRAQVHRVSTPIIARTGAAIEHPSLTMQAGGETRTVISMQYHITSCHFSAACQLNGVSAAQAILWTLQAQEKERRATWRWTRTEMNGHNAIMNSTMHRKMNSSTPAECYRLCGGLGRQKDIEQRRLAGTAKPPRWLLVMRHAS